MFVTEVEAAVAEGRAEAAVHSAKDMPSLMPPGLVLGAVPRRADPRDGLVGATLAGLPAGALVATGSARRRAQLAALRPDLVFTDLRGNMARRVAVAESGEVSAVVIAMAAMERLGWLSKVRDVLDPVDGAAAGGAGRHRGAVPGRRRRHQGAAGRHRPRAESPGAAFRARRAGGTGRELHAAGRRLRRAGRDGRDGWGSGCRGSWPVGTATP